MPDTENLCDGTGGAVTADWGDWVTCPVCSQRVKVRKSNDIGAHRVPSVNIKASDLPEEQHRIAITVFVLAQGVDYGDAVDRARQTIQRALPRKLPLAHRNQGVVEGAEAVIVDIMETGMAARNGYLNVQPTKRAFDV